MKKTHCILYDPIPFDGGSKVATRHMLEQTHDKVIYHILTTDLQSWHPFRLSTSLQPSTVVLYSLCCPSWLQKKSHGKLYWLKQLVYLINLLFFFCFIGIKNRCSLKKILLISSPSVDLAGYFFTWLIKPFHSFYLIQFIHGGVLGGRITAWCLKQKHSIFYLESVETELLISLKLVENDKLPNNFYPFINGITKRNWPTKRKEKAPTLLWAASLAKWKGLDTFIKACELLKLNERTKVNICYIKPKNSYVEQSQLPIALANTFLFQAPTNLDEIRANSSIFVSSSQNEPFGFSILEALAAGLLVIIPKDGAYWDKVLEDKVQCLKYEPNSSKALASLLSNAILHFDEYQSIARQGQVIAENYHAENSYFEIAKTIIADNDWVREVA